MEDFYTFDESSTRTIYTQILDHVEGIMQSINNDSKCEEIVTAQAEALVQLEAMRRQIESSLCELEQNAEWDSFTFAFYGETNAGKSTLIETLRILLSEPEKVAERDLFSKVFPGYKKHCDLMKETQTSIDDINCDYKKQLAVIEEQLQNRVEELKVAIPFLLWYCVVSKEVDTMPQTIEQFRKRQNLSGQRFRR